MTKHEPPHDRLAEMSVLGSMLMGHEQACAAQRTLTAECFYTLAHGDVFNAACALLDREEPVDLVTLRDELKKLGTLDRAGGVVYLTEIMEAVPTSANMDHYARIVQEKAAQRKMIEVFRGSWREVENGTIDWNTFDNKLDEAFSVFRKREVTIPTVKDFVDDAQDRMERRARGEDTGLATGLYPIDRKIGGLEPGELVLLMGESSSGKTALTSNILLNVALDQKRPTLFFSAEVIGPTLAIDLARIVGQTDFWRINSDGRLSPDDYQRWQEAKTTLSEANLFIDDTSGISVEELVGRASYMIEEAGVELVAVDYVQLMTAEHRCESEVLRLDYIGRKLKALAGRYRIPVIVLSQMTVTDGRRDPRFCKALMQHCDIRIDVLRTNKEYDKEPENEPDVCDRRIVIAKGRHKGTGWAVMEFDKPHLTFREIGDERTQPRDAGGDMHGVAEEGSSARRPASQMYLRDSSEDDEDTYDVPEDEIPF